MYRLIQEEYGDSPWRILVCCILLNRTTGTAVRGLLRQLFETYPGPAAMAAANPCRLYNTISFLGLGERRTSHLIRMSQMYLRYSDAGKEMTLDVRRLPGCGKYAADCWDLLVRGVAPADVKDKELRKYMEREGLLT